MVDGSRQAGADEIEITEEMTDAGVEAYPRSTEDFEWTARHDAVVDIFKAMFAVWRSTYRKTE